MIFTWEVWSRIGRLTTWIGAVGVAVAAFTGLFFTYQQYRLSRQAQTITEQGQVTDRFTKAVEQLGAEKLDVRLGGIYSLERLSRDSTADEPTIMEVLGAYVRIHAAGPPLTDPLAPVTCARDPQADVPIDIQSVVTVIARRDQNLVELEPHRVDLSESCLEGGLLFSTSRSYVTRSCFARTFEERTSPTGI